MELEEILKAKLLVDNILKGYSMWSKNLNKKFDNPYVNNLQDLYELSNVTSEAELKNYINKRTCPFCGKPLAVSNYRYLKSCNSNRCKSKVRKLFTGPANGRGIFWEEENSKN